MAYKILNVEIWDTYKFTELVHEYNKNTDPSWAGQVYNFLIDFLPDYPPSIQAIAGGG